MLEQIILQIKSALDRASARIAEGEELLALLDAAGEDVTEVRTALTAARIRRDQWAAALDAHGHTSSHEAG